MIYDYLESYENNKRLSVNRFNHYRLAKKVTGKDIYFFNGLTKNVGTETQDLTFNIYFATKLAQPKWGDSAGVFGAAFLTED
ncbi:hypothetical protein COTS27_00142 [Spirochaetota bacterium]|nr:hypothetical protein COTS27_00142 [Spirochaetota bacterium]